MPVITGISTMLWNQMASCFSGAAAG